MAYSIDYPRFSFQPDAAIDATALKKTGDSDDLNLLAANFG